MELSGQGVHGVGATAVTTPPASATIISAPPTAALAQPVDNDANDADPALNALTVFPQPMIRVQLSDTGGGINDASVTSSSVMLSRNGAPLLDGTNYTFSY